MIGLLKDIRYGVRMLRKDRAFTLLAILTLGLGIGLTSAMFSIVYGTVLRELPFAEADELVALRLDRPADAEEAGRRLDLRDLLLWRAEQSSCEGLAGWYGRSMSLSDEVAPPERFNGAYVSANTFELVRVEPVLGRSFRPADEAADARPVVLLGHAAWQRRYGGDPGVLGLEVRLNGETAEVIGVMPKGFGFPLRQELWAPLRLDLEGLERWRRGQMQVLGRLRPDRTAEEMAAELAEISERHASDDPELRWGGRLEAVAYVERYTDPRTRSSLYVMLAAVLGVLVIACANVTNLLLARSSLRTQDVAVRFALGASRGRLVAQLLAEAFLLAACGGLLGVGLAGLGIELYRRAMADQHLPFWVDVRLDPEVLFFAVALTFLASLISGLLPALRTSGTRAHEVLKDLSTGTDGRRSGRFSRALVLVEVVLSCGLLVATGLTVKSLVKLARADFGFETDYVLTAQIALQAADYPAPEDRLRFFDRLLDRLDSVSGIEVSSLTSDLPGSRARQAPLEVEGEARAERAFSPRSAWSVVSPGFFDTFGVEFLAGRPFTAADDAGSPAVAIVNLSFVHRYLGEGDPLGRKIRLADGAARPEDGAQDGWREIVGVVPDLHMAGLHKEEVPGLYLPLAQKPTSWMTLAVEARGRPQDLIPLIRKEAAALDPELPLFWVMSMDEELATVTRAFSVYGTLFTVFGLVALFLAAIGLYGVVSVSASRRVRECGLRMALGAERRDVIRLILRDGLGQLFWGLALGLVLAAALSRLLTVLLFRVEPWDPGVFLAVVVVLLAAGLTACWLPASRSARVDPIVALRDD